MPTTLIQFIHILIRKLNFLKNNILFYYRVHQAASIHMKIPLSARAFLPLHCSHPQPVPASSPTQLWKDVVGIYRQFLPNMSCIPKISAVITMSKEFHPCITKYEPYLLRWKQIMKLRYSLNIFYFIQNDYYS